MNDVAFRRPSVINGPLLKEGSKVFMLGALGAGMLPLGRVLRSFGICVEGADAACASTRDCFGITVHPSPTRLPPGVDLLVRSLALPEDAPEVLEAGSSGIPVITRAELLGELMSLARYPVSVAVSGTHGKSTTVGMLDLILERAGIERTVVTGAPLYDGAEVRLGNGLLLAEACEYRNAFHHLHPSLALITNIELDHVDFFTSQEMLYDSFRSYALGCGRVLLNTDCPTSRRLSKELGAKAVTYGSEGDYSLSGIEINSHGSRLLIDNGGKTTEVLLSVVGRGNAYDALCAFAAASELGVDSRIIASALSDFRGIGRRMERLGSIDSRPIYYDYAHHPTEIKNTLDSLSLLHGEVAVIFRPHTYTRTRSFLSEFAAVLSRARCVVVLDVYAARERAIEGVNAAALASRIKGAVWLSDSDALSYLLKNTTCPIALLGAGDVSSIIDEIRSKINGG